MTRRKDIRREALDILEAALGGDRNALMRASELSTNAILRAASEGRIGLVSGWWHRHIRERPAKAALEATRERLEVQSRTVAEARKYNEEMLALRQSAIDLIAQSIGEPTLLAGKVAALEHETALGALERARSITDGLRHTIEAEQRLEARLAMGPANISLGLARKQARLEEAQETAALWRGSDEAQEAVDERRSLEAQLQELRRAISARAAKGEPIDVEDIRLLDALEAKLAKLKGESEE